MNSKTSVIIGLALAAFSIIPSCPAPLWIWGACVVSSPLVLLGIKEKIGPSKRHIEREDVIEASLHELAMRTTWPPGVSENDVHLCRNSNHGRQIIFINESKTSVRIENVSPECMDLANLWTAEGTPQPCGSDCLNYVNLTAEYKKKLIDTAKELSS